MLKNVYGVKVSKGAEVKRVLLGKARFDEKRMSRQVFEKMYKDFKKTITVCNNEYMFLEADGKKLKTSEFSSYASI